MYLNTVHTAVSLRVGWSWPRLLLQSPDNPAQWHLWPRMWRYIGGIPQCHSPRERGSRRETNNDHRLQTFQISPGPFQTLWIPRKNPDQDPENVEPQTCVEAISSIYIITGTRQGGHYNILPPSGPWNTLKKAKGAGLLLGLSPRSKSAVIPRPPPQGYWIWNTVLL